MAIDFETANYNRNSACALGLVKVEHDRIVHQSVHLIRPPQNRFVFTYLHGITWEDVRNEPTFGQLWHQIAHHFRDIDFVVAHNKSFDRSVLAACCTHEGIPVPQLRFECTMEHARRLWNIHPTKLPDVCEYFGISLNHHDALSDTLACARIMMEALKSVTAGESHTPSSGDIGAHHHQCR
jgi:DNA polymerase III subunit epsilon